MTTTKRSFVTACAIAGLALASGSILAVAGPPSTWDNLVKVKSKRFEAVYLLPGADFTRYHKIMLEPSEAAFEKNFVRDYNSNQRGLGSQLTQAKADKGLVEVRKAVDEVFHKAYTKAGYQLVTHPGPDVLKLRNLVVNLYVNAPDVPTAGRTRSYAPEAGRATIVIEARDSMTGTLLGRAADAQLVGDVGPYIRNSVTNRSDFTQTFKAWADKSVKGLGALRTETVAQAAQPKAAG
jgi:hypothetical protein